MYLHLGRYRVDRPYRHVATQPPPEVPQEHGRLDEHAPPLPLVRGVAHGRLLRDREKRPLLADLHGRSRDVHNDPRDRVRQDFGRVLDLDHDGLEDRDGVSPVLREAHLVHRFGVRNGEVVLVAPLDGLRHVLRRALDVAVVVVGDNARKVVDLVLEALDSQLTLLTLGYQRGDPHLHALHRIDAHAVHLHLDRLTHKLMTVLIPQLLV